MSIRKLTRKQFYTVYGVSLLAEKAQDSDLEYLAGILNPIAQRYADITACALRSEIRYFSYGYNTNGFGTPGDRIDRNMELASRLNLRPLDWVGAGSKSLKIDDIIIMFNEGYWGGGWGGKAWGRIATAQRGLLNVLPSTRSNLKQVVMSIDRLNDLEHNNALYLQSYCCFDLSDALQAKYGGTPEVVLKYCPPEFQKMYREYNRRSPLTSSERCGIL